MNFYKRITIVLLSLFGFGLLHMPDTGFSKDACIDQKALFQGRESVRVQIPGLLKKIKWENKRTGESWDIYELQINPPICDKTIIVENVEVTIDEDVNISSYVNRRVSIVGELTEIYAGKLAVALETIQREGNTIDKKPLDLKRKQGGHPASESVTAKGKDTEDSVFKMKGLYIGMDIKEAEEKLRKLLPDLVFKLWINKDNEEVLSEDGPAFMKDLFVDFVWADSNHKVTRIFLNRDKVNKLFSVEDMDSEMFVEEFQKAYRIPRFERKVESGYNIWTEGPSIILSFKYTDPSGFAITIGQDKDIKFEKVSSAKERKFD